MGNILLDYSITGLLLEDVSQFLFSFITFYFFSFLF